MSFTLSTKHPKQTCTGCGMIVEVYCWCESCMELRATVNLMPRDCDACHKRPFSRAVVESSGV